MKTRLLGIVSLCAAAGVLASAGAWLWLAGGAKNAAPAVSAPVASAQDGTMRSGIGVRGHWVIEVRNPDGTLDRREEFDNALMYDGSILAALLTKHRHLQAWHVNLRSEPFSHIIEEAGPAGKVEGTQVNQYAYTLKPEFVDVAGSGGDFVRLTGKVTAVNDTQITAVATSLRLCTSFPCVTYDLGMELTYHDLAQPIPILKDQQVLVTIEIKFQAA